MTHTKGPWKLANDAQGPCMIMHPSIEGVAIASLTDAHKPVNGFVGVESLGAPERTANARLIAAAPELLEELEDILCLLESTTKGNITIKRNGAKHQAIKALIAKAEGRY